ncbi:hypothetical protein J1605_021308 [Eschrichtius robustus]|uniref:Uncharacterized protein n=1 Tax=Eschrichtius robustus TaxID=9764 RepID=A0AB34HET5_ESCRO|nr:hypothetical protein J1605_021308 [Eschrichtius robustus]
MPEDLARVGRQIPRAETWGRFCGSRGVCARLLLSCFPCRDNMVSGDGRPKCRLVSVHRLDLAAGDARCPGPEFFASLSWSFSAGAGALRAQRDPTKGRPLRRWP